MNENKSNPSGGRGLIGFFRSEYFVLITFVSLITPLMAHTASLLLQVSNIKSVWYAYFFAFSFDLAIFAFSINGRRSQATGLAFIVFILNVCFFNLDTLSDMVGNRQLVRLFVTVIISGAGSWIVHSYVVFFNEKIGEPEEVAMLIHINEEKEKRINALQRVIADVRKDNDDLKSRLKQSSANNTPVTSHSPVSNVTDQGEEIIFPYTCSNCAHTALTPLGFDGIVRHCKSNNCRFKVKGEITSELLILK